MANLTKFITKYPKFSYALSMLLLITLVLFFGLPEYRALTTGTIQPRSGNNVSLNENPSGYYFVVLKQGVYTVGSLLLLLLGIWGGVKRWGS